MNQFSRTEALLGADAMARLAAARVAVFGLGGVGGHAAEALVRSGVGAIDLIDNDRVSETNLNRQLVALHSTVGMPKVEALAQRLRDINPDIRLTLHPLFYLPETADAVNLSVYDCVLDAVDTVSAKLELIVRTNRLGIPLISAMGAGNKLDPTQLRSADIYETRECRLARVIRSECRKRGVGSLRVVYSPEPPVITAADTEEAPPDGRRAIPGSAAFVPAAMGLIMAAEAVGRLATGSWR